ncbi:MAG: 4Fe-4S binding protein [Oscillospiraceae bacterium]|nr:4Fe-4S binding protein [Oscillospiraceae bacterium]
MPYIINPKGMNKCLGCLTCVTVCAAVNQESHSVAKSAIRIRTTGGMTGSIVAVVCRGCQAPACKEACPAGALLPRPGGGVTLDADLCYGCRKCVPACSVGAVNFDRETQKPIICCHCGICTTFCTHGCIMMTEVREESGHGG